MSEKWQPNRLDLELEAPAGSVSDLPIRVNRPDMRVSSADRVGDVLRVRFTGNPGYQRITVIFLW